MARKRERIFAGFFAGLFLASSCALTVAVIYQQIQDNKKPSNGAASQNSSQQLTDAQKKALAAAQAQTKPKETTVTPLKGTALAGYTPQPSIDSLQKIDTIPGTGAAIKSSDTITVDYTGALASTGIVFESSKDSGQPATFPLNGVIQGWVQGLPGMQVGGTRRLLIPASLGYGAKGAGSIPPNADLVFDVTLIKIGK